jgi:hypothetical protein
MNDGPAGRLLGRDFLDDAKALAREALERANASGF